MGKKCPECNQSVYTNDKQTSIDGNLYHNTCFKCSKCRCQLTLSNFTSGGSRLLCKTHYFEEFSLNNSYGGNDKYKQRASCEVNGGEIPHTRTRSQSMIPARVISNGLASQSSALPTVADNSAMAVATPVVGPSETETPVDCVASRVRRLSEATMPFAFSGATPKKTSSAADCVGSESVAARVRRLSRVSPPVSAAAPKSRNAAAECIGTESVAMRVRRLSEAEAPTSAPAPAAPTPSTKVAGLASSGVFVSTRLGRGGVKSGVRRGPDRPSTVGHGGRTSTSTSPSPLRPPKMPAAAAAAAAKDNDKGKSGEGEGEGKGEGEGEGAGQEGTSCAPATITKTHTAPSSEQQSAGAAASKCPQPAGQPVDRRASRDEENIPPAPSSAAAPPTPPPVGPGGVVGEARRSLVRERIQAHQRVVDDKPQEQTGFRKLSHPGSFRLRAGVSGGKKCGVCGKTVYQNDPQTSIDGSTYHKQCFKCSMCKCQLTLSSFTSGGGGDLLCKTHYFERFSLTNTYSSEGSTERVVGTS